MWTYEQRTGILSRNDKIIATGYSGTGKGRNNPDMEQTEGVGPIPAGKYTIGAEYRHPKLGPIVMNLDPEEGTNEWGRSLFRIHGNNAENDASHGCIILPRPIRQQIADSNDKELEVVK